MKRRIVFLVLVATVIGYSVLGQSNPPMIEPVDYACYPTGIRPGYIVSADLLKDGWYDLVVACRGSNQVWKYINQGSGIFGQPTRVAVPLGPVALVAGQLIAGWGAQIAVLSQFTPAVSTIPTGIPGYPLGFPPLVAPQHMAAGRLDQGNVLLDLVVVDSGLGVTPTLHYFVGGVWAPGIALPAGTNPSFVTVADLNNDRWDDVIVADSSRAGRRIHIYMNSAGTLPATPTWTIPVGSFDPVGIDTADFNGDGFIDIVVVGNDESNGGWARVFLNTVNPSGFVPLGAPLQTWGLGTTFVKAFDADGHGRPEFVTANHASQTITVFLTETLQRATAANVVTRPMMGLANYRKATIKIAPIFKFSLHCGYHPTSITAQDFDLNGKMDIAITLESATPVIDPQQPSCIKIIFDVASGFQGSAGFVQISHAEVVRRARASGQDLPQVETICVPCQTEGDSKNP